MNKMAATAKKGQNVYAPSRVYSYSRAATAEKLPYEEAESIPAQIPRAEPKRHAAPQTRIMREATTAQKRKQRTLPKLISVTGVLMIAAVMIGLVFRYASIASVTALIAQRPERQGYDGIKSLCNHLLFKQGSEKVNLMPIDILLKENLKYYLNNKL